ncbi:hypothetical protein [Deinococcus hopiensis]|uniref:hypothetical protein n=1 Tax=Deinococcus hopiensis TaxID=309885 RepID=UPI0014829FAF|nr:hypothetical protein [Deinococcus hopiensis]
MYSLQEADSHLDGDLALPSPFLPHEDAPPGWFETMTDDANYDRAHDGVLPITE